MSSGVFRTQKTENFTTVRNDFINDPRLSAKAKGLLLYLLSKPDDWVTRIDDICEHMADGIASIQTGLKELEKAGYFCRRRLKSDRGQFSGWETLVFETPLPKVDFQLSDESTDKSGFTPKVDFPISVKPISDFPISENRPLLNTDLLLNTEKEDLKRFETNRSVQAGEVDSELPLVRFKKQAAVGGNDLYTPPPVPGTPPQDVATPRAKKKKARSKSKYFPEECEALWQKWDAFFREMRGDRDGLQGFVQGFDYLIEQGERLEDVVEGTEFYIANKLASVKAGKNPILPPDGIRFFKGKKDHPSSYCLDALAFKRERTRANDSDISHIRSEIGAELERLKINAVLPGDWQERTGATLVTELGLKDAIAYLKYLKGVDHANSAA